MTRNLGFEKEGGGDGTERVDLHRLVKGIEFQGMRNAWYFASPTSPDAPAQGQTGRESKAVFLLVEQRVNLEQFQQKWEPVCVRNCVETSS